MRVSAGSWQQVLRFLINKFGAGIRHDIREHEWHFFRNRKSMDVAELPFKLDCKELVIIPKIKARSNFFKTIIGVAAIVVGAYFNQPWLVQFGIGMAISGVLGFLVKPPKPSEQGQSGVFDQGPNIYAQGTPIPLVYGKCLAGSVIIGSDFSSDWVG